MKIYIAGAITDDPNYKEHFKAAEERLKAAGHAVINPCKNEGFTYREYINMGLCELMQCDAIYLLKGYDQSTGATLEHDYARTVGLAVFKEEDDSYWKKIGKNAKDINLYGAATALKELSKAIAPYFKDWEKARINVFLNKTLLNVHASPYVLEKNAYCESLMERYRSGERTQELYDAMMRVH